MNPQEFRLTLLAACLLLALFGILYNWLIDISAHVKWTQSLTAISVVLGVTVTMMVVGAFFNSPSMWQAISILFAGFVSSGLPMIIGHRRRYMKALREEQKARELDKEARNGHRRMRWPYEMKKLRDAAAENVMGALRDLSNLPNALVMDEGHLMDIPEGVSMDREQILDERLKVASAREKLAKALGQLVKAGAHAQIEDV